MDLLVASKTEIENFDIFNSNVRSLIVKVKFRLSYTLHITECGGITCFDGLIVDYTENTGELYDRLGKLFASPTVTKNSSAPCGIKRE